MGCGASTNANVSHPRTPVATASLPSREEETYQTQPRLEEIKSPGPPSKAEGILQRQPGVEVVAPAGSQPPKNEDVLVRLHGKWVMKDLPKSVVALHIGMPRALRAAPMRILKIGEVLAWAHLHVYEDVPPSACIEVPYVEVPDEMWEQTAVLSWRWGAPKPSEMQPGFTPMLQYQFKELRAVLTQLHGDGMQYIWIDWCCVPQYSSSPMVEIMRSKAFYMRARAMVIIPTFNAIPDEGIVRLLLGQAARNLEHRGQEKPLCAIAAAVINSIIDSEIVAGREYFSRVWTLAERMARHGRSEQLCNWLSLEAWLGMVVDAMLKSTEDKTASQIYKKILGKEAGDLLDSILDPLSAAVETSSMMVSEDLDELVAKLFEMAVVKWTSQSILEEAPTKQWLVSYLEEAHTGVYQAWNETDRVWAVYSYFCWKQLDQLQPSALMEALHDLARVAGAHRRHVLGLARKLGVDTLLPVEEIDMQLIKAVESGNSQLVRSLIEQGANHQVVNGKEDCATLLCAACQNGNLEVVKLLIAAGTPINAGNPTSGRAPIHIAVQNGHTEVVKYLLDKGANKDAPLEDGATPLIVAAEKGEVEALRLLIHAGANLYATNEECFTPIHIACRFGHLAVIKALIEARVDKDLKKSNTGATPLVAAAAYGHTDTVRYLLSLGADKNIPKLNGFTHIHLASQEGYVEVVKLLIEAGVDKDLRVPESGSTPMLCAAAHDHLDVVRFLLSVGADKNLVTNEGWGAIHFACKEGYLEVVKLLIEVGVDKDLRLADESGASLLHLAAASGRVDVVAFLLSVGADKTLAKTSGFTPIHIASQNGHVEVVKLLIEAGVDKDMLIACGGSSTPLHVAAYNGQVDVVKFLLLAGAERDKTNQDGWAPIHNAATTGEVEVLKVLIEAGADKDMLSSDARTPLCMAASAGFVDAVKCLLAAGADQNKLDKDGRTVLHNACASGRVEVIQALIEAGMDKNRRMFSNESGSTPLYLAASFGHAGAVRFLLSIGADLELAHQDGSAPIHIACKKGHADVAKILIEAGADKDQWMTNEKGATPLYLAASNGHLGVVRVLLSLGVDKNKANIDGWSPVHGAAENGHTEVLKALIEAGADIDRPLASTGKTPVHMAALNGFADAVRILTSAGATTDKFDQDGSAPIHLAAQNGHVEVLKALIHRAGGDDKNLRRPTDGVTPLYLTSRANQVDAARYLLSVGADKEIARNDGVKPWIVGTREMQMLLDGKILR